MLPLWRTVPVPMTIRIFAAGLLGLVGSVLALAEPAPVAKETSSEVFSSRDTDPTKLAKRLGQRPVRWPSSE